MTEYTQTMDIKKFKTYFPSVKGAEIGDDFFVAELTYGEQLKGLNYPCRFDGYLAIFCLEGDVDVDINLKTYNIKATALMCTVPGNIIRISAVNSDIMKIRFILVALSKEYISRVHFDMAKLFSGNVIFLDDPVIPLSGENLRICREYLELCADLLSSEIALKGEATLSLISSVFYVLGSLWQNRAPHSRLDPADNNSLRVKTVFDQFIKLVTDYHTSERRMAFYAEKLCLSPKYLSKLIKEASGRSAPDWIDSFVVLEAKNMLKYSDISIKEIVYKLHFANQSVFYKFFKSHTGMTPSEYRNS